ncbi:MAG TPA: hypothetical protein V6D08_19730 [Candidatus Obscuribacterales bacterium]
MKIAAGLPALLFCLFMLLFASGSAGAFDPAPAGIADGPGIWVNIWHYPEGDLDVYCSRLRAHGIRNLFIQTSRSNTDALPHAEKLGAVIEACHRQGIRVIAWSFAELVDPKGDAAKMIAAARYRSPQGEGIDGIAPNLEKNLERWRVELYSQELRRALGPNYPMMAVVFSPLNKAPEVARTPWTLLPRYYDVIAPMAYWGGRRQSLDAYTYTSTTIQKVRQLTGSAHAEIHVIGDGMGTGATEIDQFLRACKAAEATSASLYPNHRPTPDQLAALARYPDFFPENARFRLAAFKGLVRSGALRCPPDNDPSRPVSRGEFYKLAVHQLYRPMARRLHVSTEGAVVSAPTAGDARDPSGLEAYRMLVSAGVVAGDPEIGQWDLESPIGSGEALSVIAGLVELQSEGPGHSFKRHARVKQRPDRWLVPPARAEAAQPGEQRAGALNYLDAAEMVLQARAGLR